MARKTNIFLAIGLVLVAILAGCSDKASYPPYPVSVYIEQTGDFLEGQSFSSSNFTVTVRYFDGSEKEYPNTSLKFGGANGIVKAGDTVSINVGTDINGKSVENTITLDVFKLGNITATAAKESYVAGETPKAEDVTVTAHYENNGELILKATDYTVGNVTVDTPDPTKEIVDGHFTVTVNPSIAAAGTPGSTYDVPVSVTQTAYTGNIVSVDGIAAYGVGENATTFRLGKLNYTGSEDLPAIDYSKVYVEVTTDAEEGQNTDYVLASDIEGLELSYVSMVSGEALDDRYDSYAFASTVADTDTEVGIVATYEETTTEALALQVDQLTAVELQYGGKGIVEGTVLNDEDEPAAIVDDYRVYLTVNGEKGLVDDVTAADFTFYDAESAGSVEDAMPAVDGSVWASVDYKGAVSNRVEIKALAAAEKVYTISAVEFAKDQPASLLKINYTTAPTAPAADSDLLKSVTVEGLEDPITADWTAAGISVAYSVSNEKIVAFDDENKDLSDVDTVYLAVTYTWGEDPNQKTTTFFAPVSVVEPTADQITKLELKAAYTVTKGGVATTPMYGSGITWTLTGTTSEGTFDIDPAAAEYWIDGQPAEFSDVPTTVSDKEVKVLAVYKGVESGATAGTETPVAKGTAYIDPNGISVEATEDMLEAVYIGDKYSKAATSSTNTSTYYKLTVAEDAHVGGTVSGDDAGKITEVVAPSSVAVLNETGNQVTVKVTYLAEDGTTKTKDCIVEFDAQSWATETEAGSLDVTLNGTISLADSSEDDAVILPSGGNYSIAVSGLTEHGENAYTVTAEALEGTVSLNGNTLTIGGYSRAKITVSYADNSTGTIQQKSVDFFASNTTGV